MSIFEPRSMDRDRGQLLYRYRPTQTFDHPGGFIAQVRQYGPDDAFDGPAVDRRYLIAEAQHLVRRWRAEGRGTAGAEPGSDRAPEFPTDDPLAAEHYEVVIPGKVFCRVWPRVVRCSRPTCGRIWAAQDPVPGAQWPEPCPSCTGTEAQQLQYVFVHPCGEVVAMEPPYRPCAGCGASAFRLDDRASRFLDFRWECMRCSTTQDVRAFCRNNACAWTEKMMAPQVHTASSAYMGQSLTLVNVPLEEHAQRRNSPEFILGCIGRWLGECTDEEASQLLASGDGGPPPEILEAITALETAGATEQARNLRTRFVPVEVDTIRERVTARLGFDPLEDLLRGPQLAANLDVFERVRQLPRLTLSELEALAASAGRATLYANYRPTLERHGFNPHELFLVKEFPVTYLAVGYARSGFGPLEADLVAYRGRAGRNQAVKTLLYAHPTVTEALVFTLDEQRVARWLIANEAATVDELAEPGGVARWFAAHMDEYDGRLPPPWDPECQPDRADPEYGPRLLFTLLHSLAHQMLRALAVDSGYSETALSEYLFPYALAFAIHPNGGSEFTIGGLRTVLEQNLAEVVTRAGDNDTCIYDPNCMVANRGADHGCLQLPETACQAWNWFISRWELYGSPDGEVIGYWSPELDPTPA
ncbi:MAG: hypothetical protein ACLP1Q_07280 [Solirubrobacteraceae bacterium]